MARIRTIKPEFWTDGAIIRLPYEVRLFYIGMWNHSCDRGHLPDDAFGLKLKILPADPVDGESMIQQLIAAGRVERVVSDGRPFLAIPRFSDHQRIDPRWKARCPVCADLDTPELPETHVSSRETPGIETKSHVGGEGKGGEGEGKGKERKGGEDASAPPPPRYCINHPNGTEKPCRPCMSGRQAYEAWEAAEAAKPRPLRIHEHRWFPDGTCANCEERRDP